MPKGPLITDDVERVIAGVYLDHREWVAKEIRGEVEKRLRKANPKLKPGWPGLSAVQKELTKIRETDKNRPPELKELDKPWSLASLKDYPIAPGALPAVLEAYALLETERKWDPNSVRQPLTVRQALWISRLSGLLATMGVKGLLAWASFYAIEERVSEISGRPFVTQKVDQGLVRWLREHMLKVLRMNEEAFDNAFPERVKGFKIEPWPVGTEPAGAKENEAEE